MKNQERFWANYFKTYDVMLQLIPYRNLLTTLVEKANLKKGERLLDAGCGTGNLLYEIPEGIEVISFDNSISALQRLKYKFKNACAFQGSLLSELPFEDNSLDVIITNNVLYTIEKEKRPQVIKEFRRILKSGGRIVVSNLKEGFDPFITYKTHIKAYRQLHGIANTLIHLIMLIIPTIKIFYYNYKIIRMDQSQSYSFLKEDEQKEDFENAGFMMEGETELVYADQGVMDVFVNKKIKTRIYYFP